MSALSELSSDIERVVRDASPSVVAIENRRGQGSGFLIAPDGVIVTNSHVVRGARRVEVRVGPSERVGGDLVGDDPASDLAVIKLDGWRGPSLPVLETRRLRVGELVLAIGNPLRFERSATLGIVSALDRTLPAGRGRALEGLVQTDAAINPGSSGGPLLDATGVVVGVTTAMIPMARGLGFAVPAHTMGWVVSVLLRDGRIERPRLGLAARGFELAPADAAEFGQLRAVGILDVGSGEPAEQAGLRKDDLLLRVNGAPVGSVDDIVRTMVLSNGAELSLDVARVEERLTLRATPRRERRAA